MDTQSTLHERIGGADGLQRLLRQFYADVRQHQLLGPIFNRQIKDWPAHLELIGGFWARLTGGPSEYSGGMPAKHLALGIDGQHFTAWLQLWDFNCARQLKAPEAQELSALAHGIGERLHAIVTTHSRGV